MEDRSLKNNIDAVNKINDIRLSLNSEVGSKIVWILVEGEDDCRIYPKFFDETKARVEFVNGGKGQLTIALKTLTTETKQVIGIQDADFLHLGKVYPTVTNLFYTDYHDIEMTMLSFETVRANLFTEYRISNSQTVWQNILEESSYMAYIRWDNDINGNKILFSRIKFGGNLSEIKDGKIKLHKQELLNELNTRSSNKTKELICADMESFIATKKTTDILNLCNGHDVISLLALIVGGQVSYKELCRHLRLSFTLTEFSKTNLYAQLSGWQIENGYAILKNVA
jgi:hypothetical protein